MDRSPFTPPDYQPPQPADRRPPHHVPQHIVPPPQYEQVAPPQPPAQPYPQPQYQPQPAQHHQPAHHRVPHQAAHQAAANDPEWAGYSGARSIEYVFMTIALLATAFSLSLTLLFWTNGWLKDESSSGAAVYPVAMLIISLPLYAALLLDVKEAELHDPSLRRSIYRRLSNQLVRVVAFITCFFAVVGLVYGVLAHAASSTAGGSLWHVFVNAAIFLVIAGGILAYYMRYES
jgi:hypothetical protein